MSGRVTRPSTVQRPAPSVRAASSYRESSERRPASTVSTRNGIDTKVSAITTPAVVKGSVIPKPLSNSIPRRPRRPKARRRAMPPTTGGRTMGSVVKARSRFRPGNSTRA